MLNSSPSKRFAQKWSPVLGGEKRFNKETPRFAQKWSPVLGGEKRFNKETPRFAQKWLPVLGGKKRFNKETPRFAQKWSPVLGGKKRFNKETPRFAQKWPPVLGGKKRFNKETEQFCEFIKNRTALEAVKFSIKKITTAALIILLSIVLIPELILEKLFYKNTIHQALANQSFLPEKLKGHGGPVKSIELDGEDRLALSSSFDYSIILWDLSEKKGKIKHRMLGHNAGVNDVAFVPNGKESPKKAVSVSDDGSFAIWDLTTGQLAKLVEDTGDKVLDVTVSQNGKFAATARWDGTARLFDIEQQKQVSIFKGHRGNVNSVIFGKDKNGQDNGLLFSASYDGDIRAWHVGQNANKTNIQHGSTIHSNGWGINVIHLMPGGEEILYGTLNGDVTLLNINKRTTKKIGNFKHPILSLATNKNSEWFAAGSSDGYIRIFNLKTLKQIEQYQNFIGPVWGLAFSKNGKTLYRSGLDDFVSRWQVSPKEGFKVSDNLQPRRFQIKRSTDPGEIEFQRKCSVCHTLGPDDKNRAGPTLYKLFGREAGTLEGYEYSKALIASKLIWNEETIGRLFDEGPDIVTPGSKMPIQRLKSVDRRDALIKFLKKATAPQTQGKN